MALRITTPFIDGPLSWASQGILAMEPPISISTTYSIFPFYLIPLPRVMTYYVLVLSHKKRRVDIKQATPRVKSI